jgi:hypothetical protein
MQAFFDATWQTAAWMGVAAFLTGILLILTHPYRPQRKHRKQTPGR